MIAAVPNPAKVATARKSLLHDVDEVRLAAEMVAFGARLQVLEAEVSLSRERLTRLYKELRGVSPPKGQLPFSPDWFLAWRPNIHASLFLSAYDFLVTQSTYSRIECVLAAYRLYVEQAATIGEESILSFTRAWTLIRFVEIDTLKLCPCSSCGGKYVRHTYDLQDKLVCGLCAPPPRAATGRGRQTSTPGDVQARQARQPREPVPERLQGCAQPHAASVSSVQIEAELNRHQA